MKINKTDQIKSGLDFSFNQTCLFSISRHFLLHVSESVQHSRRLTLSITIGENCPLTTGDERHTRENSFEWRNRSIIQYRMGPLFEVLQKLHFSRYYDHPTLYLYFNQGTHISSFYISDPMPPPPRESYRLYCEIQVEITLLDQYE